MTATSQAAAANAHGAATVDGDALGDDLGALVRSIGTALVEARSLPSEPGVRATAFRLTFADGRVMKAQVLGSAAAAERVERLARYLDLAQLPKVIGRSGLALLFEWVDGEPLSALKPTAGLLHASGTLLARMHCIPLPNADRARPAPRVLARDTKLRNDLALLTDVECLTPAEAHAALEFAVRFTPRDFTIGIEHGDFCAENILVDPCGKVWVIDNELLRIDAHDHDLGRTWYRWPLGRAERESFFEGYRRHRSVDVFFQFFPYWAITATVDGAAFRLRHRRTRVHMPLQRLRNLLAELQRGTSAEGAVFSA